MSKHSKGAKQATKAQAKAEKAEGKGERKADKAATKAEKKVFGKEDLEPPVPVPNGKGPVEPPPIEEAAKPLPVEQHEPPPPNEEPPKPVVTYEILSTEPGPEEETDRVRVNVKVNPPFNGFDEAVITLDVPHSKARRKGEADHSDRDALIKDKAAWKVNQSVGMGGGAKFTAEEVKTVEEAKEA